MSTGTITVLESPHADNAEPATLPRSFAFYERQADRLGVSQHDMIDALASALNEVELMPSRYAELMRIIDSWLVRDYVHVVDNHFRHAKAPLCRMEPAAGQACPDADVR